MDGEEVITVNIPAGVADGMQLSMSGKGNAPERGGIPGDLIILIEEVEDPILKRDGTQVEIPTVGGKVKLKIDAGTQAGKILRLRGKGLPELNSGYTGDQLVQVNVWTPKKLSGEERALLEKLRTSENFAPKPEKGDQGFFDRMKEFFN